VPETPQIHNTYSEDQLMSEHLNRAIEELEKQAEYHESAAVKARQALQQVRSLLGGDAPAGKRGRPRTGSVPANGRRATKVRSGGAKPSLADAIAYVLRERGKAHASGPTAKQLFQEVQQAGYHFGGKTTDYRMGYLYRILRDNKTQFKRGGDGTYSMS
jgi:hypothetical protein